MPVLTSAQRNSLEKAITHARRLSEAGAYHALEALAVTEAEPFKHQSPEQRSLRNRLRSKGRLLGDKLENTGKQQIDHLAYELAYEYWHKMLFAQFLESNGLLMHPQGVAVTMEECEELAKEEGHIDKWATAAAYASKMLPAIFRIEDPLMEVEFAPNDRIALETILENMEDSVYTADDALGWVYQFWQSEEKERINDSGDKIDGEKLPAVTQLFTEPYMVHFLIDNTIGAWWVGRHPGVTPPIKFEYLRLLDDGSPASGKFEGWPGATAEITSLDPCMGSGHFVASLFSVFANLRIFEENLSKEEATDKVFEQNLFGLELDPRCTQLAAFNLALTAWKFCGHYKQLPEMNLACSGMAPKGKKEDWVKLVGKVKRDDQARMENGMRVLYDHFQLAPELGSLLNPYTIKPDAFTASFEELQPVLVKALAEEADNDELERGVIAAGIAKAGQILAKKYFLQITNVPYLTKGKQGEVLEDYCAKHFPESKGDLANVFLEKMLQGNIVGGISCIVMPQNWLFLTSYKKLREKLLKNETWRMVARLGVKSFQTPMWDFNVMLISIEHANPSESQLISGLDVSEFPNAATKDERIRIERIKQVNQIGQLTNPDARVVLENTSSSILLQEYADAYIGQRTGDGPRFIKHFWELFAITKDWVCLGSTVESTSYFNGCSQIMLWEDGKGSLAALQSELAKYSYASGGWKQGWQAWNKLGVRVSQMGALPSTIHTAAHFDNNSAVIIAKKDDYLPAIWCFCSSTHFNIEVRKIDQKLNVTNATLVKVPFDMEYWQRIAAEKYPIGLPKPYSDNATQWLFHGHPLKADAPLQVAASRMFGYCWPAESDKEMELADEARELIKAIQAFDYLADDDGIVCIPSVNGEPTAADALRNYLKQVWGKQWHNNTIEELLQKERSSKINLEDWLREEFFVQHCKVFQNRPFIWHIWDGRKDGFSALVNYLKLSKENLQKLIYTYLGDWIRQCESKVRTGQSGADGQLSAAKKLKHKLELILEGEAPYDIFVRWKTLEQQSIGWDPDLNDGVRLNIRPFIEADVLRKKPNIKWGIDRGKNPPDSPWGEIRDNDRHLSLAEKSAKSAKRKK